MPSTVVDQKFQLQTSSSKRTKRGLEHLALIQDDFVPSPPVINVVHDSDMSIDDFICNLSLAVVLADPLALSYHEIVKFMEKVCSFICLPPLLLLSKFYLLFNIF